MAAPAEKLLVAVMRGVLRQLGNGVVLRFGDLRFLEDFFEFFVGLDARWPAALG
jgi:hypothetical protein